MLAIGNIADVYKPEYRMKLLYNFFDTIFLPVIDTEGKK